LEDPKKVLDKYGILLYNVAKLANVDRREYSGMATKTIASTQVQNNFGQVLDDVTQNRARYVIERRGVPQAVLLSLDDFTCVLGDKGERQQMGTILRELRPAYQLGRILDQAAQRK